MSMSVASGDSTQLTWHRHLTARAAAGTARLLIRLPPRRLRRFLEVTGAGTRPATEEQALAARAAVVTVSSRCAGQGCLQRSVATVLLCQLRGVRPDWCTGCAPSRSSRTPGWKWAESRWARATTSGSTTR